MICKKAIIGLAITTILFFECGCVDEKTYQCFGEKLVQYLIQKTFDDDIKTREADNMKTLTIKWKRLVSAGETCPRCGSTEDELDKAISTLKQSLTPIGIKIILEKDEITLEEFEKDPLKSNQIWINEKPLEDWIGGTVGESPCCDVCGPVDCRTVAIGQEVYESIPADLIIKAGLLAASELIGSGTGQSCCEGDIKNDADSGCCPK